MTFIKKDLTKTRLTIRDLKRGDIFIDEDNNFYILFSCDIIPEEFQYGYFAVDLETGISFRFNETDYVTRINNVKVEYSSNDMQEWI